MASYHFWPARTARRSASGAGARRGRAGQTLVEFALVAPMFFIVVLAACQLFCWSYDKQLIARAIRLGASAGNEAMAPVNFRFAYDPNLDVIYLPNVSKSGPSSDIFSDLAPAAAACRRVANAAPASARLGWDWGCVYDISSGAEVGKGLGAAPGDSARALQAPLDNALSGAYTELSGFFLGPESSGTISACYATWNSATASPAPVLCRVGTFADNLANPLSIAWGTDSVNTIAAEETTPAPSFLMLSITVKTLKLDTSTTILSFLNSTITLNATTVQVLNRYLPSCTAPLTSASYVAGGCGSAF